MNEQIQEVIEEKQDEGMSDEEIQDDLHSLAECYE